MIPRWHDGSHQPRKQGAFGRWSSDLTRVCARTSRRSRFAAAELVVRCSVIFRSERKKIKTMTTRMGCCNNNNKRMHPTRNCSQATLLVCGALTTTHCCYLRVRVRWCERHIFPSVSQLLPPRSCVWFFATTNRSSPGRCARKLLLPELLDAFQPSVALARRARPPRFCFQTLPIPPPLDAAAAAFDAP